MYTPPSNPETELTNFKKSISDVFPIEAPSDKG